MRTGKKAHVFDIVEILIKLDKNKEIPTFVIASFDLSTTHNSYWGYHICLIPTRFWSNMLLKKFKCKIIH